MESSSSRTRIIGEIDISDEKRFWALVKKQESGCWEWQGTRCKGYGKFASKGGRKIIAHRLAYYLATGIDPVGRLVTHNCDNPPCVNPAHLKLGNEFSNAMECIERGRAYLRSKLTSDEVAEIRHLHREGIGYKRLAKRFGVSRSSVQSIVKRKRRNRN